MNKSERMNELDPKAMLCFSFTDKGPPCRKMSLLHPPDRLCLEHCSCQGQPGPDSHIFCPHSPTAVSLLPHGLFLFLSLKQIPESCYWCNLNFIVKT